MRLYTNKLGNTLSKESTLFFDTINHKASDYNKTSFNKAKLESIIELAYKKMGLYNPHIVYVESISELYAIIHAFDSNKKSLKMSLGSDEFTCRAILPELNYINTSYLAIQESIISQAEAESTGFDYKYLITKIKETKQYKKLIHWRKYHSYNSYTDKSFVRGKKVSLSEHQLFPSEPSILILNSFLLNAGINLNDAEKKLIDTQDNVLKAAYNIFAFNGLCLVLLKQNPDKYLLPDHCFTKSNSELSKIIHDFVIENPLLISSYFYQDEEVLRFCFDGLLYSAFNTANPSFNQWVIVQETRYYKTGKKKFKDYIGNVNNPRPDWTIYPIDDLILIYGSYLKVLYSALIMRCRVEVNYKNLYKVLDKKGFPMTEEQIDALVESDELREELIFF